MEKIQGTIVRVNTIRGMYEAFRTFFMVEGDTRLFMYRWTKNYYTTEDYKTALLTKPGDQVTATINSDDVEANFYDDDSFFVVSDFMVEFQE